MLEDGEADQSRRSNSTLGREPVCKKSHPPHLLYHFVLLMRLLRMPDPCSPEVKDISLAMDWNCSYLPMLHCPILSISIPGSPGSFPACAISYSVYQSFWYKFLSINRKALNPSKAFSVVVERARTRLGSRSLTFNRWDTYTYSKSSCVP